MHRRSIRKDCFSLLTAALCLLVAVPAGATTYHVATNGNDSASGLNWGNSLLTISNAVAKAMVAGDIVMVSNGTYTVEDVVITNAIAVQGTNGSAVTILSNPGNDTRHFDVSDSGAVIDGFTLTGASYNSLGHGASVKLNGGTLQNCTVSNNATIGWVYGGTIYMLGSSVVSNCIIADNTTAGIYGGGLYMASANALAIGSIISNNTVAAWGGGAYVTAGTLRNCLIVTNRITLNNGSYHGGGVALYGANSAIENCTIADNHVGVTTKGAGVYLHKR